MCVTSSSSITMSSSKNNTNNNNNSSSNTSGKSSNSKSSTNKPPNRSGAHYEETIVHGKKRKVWRASQSATANMMSPEAAANYLQQAAEAAAAAAAAAAGSGGDSSVQITLGPNGSISAHSTTSSGATTTMSTNNPMMNMMNPNAATTSMMSSTVEWMNSLNLNTTNSGLNAAVAAASAGSGATFNPFLSGLNLGNHKNAVGGASVSFGNLDLAALAKAGDLSALTSAAARNVAASAAGGGMASAPYLFGTNSTNTPPGTFSGNPLDALRNAPTTMSSFNTTVAANITNNIKVNPANMTPTLPPGACLNNATLNNNTNKAPGGKDSSLPCSEAEMKALMSMFVEIMGMSMDTSLLGKSTAAKKRAAKAKKNGENLNNSSNSNIFTFGDDKNGAWPDPAIAAATGDLDALNAHRYAYSDDEDDEDDDSLPDLDDMKQIQKDQQERQSSEGDTCSGENDKSDDASGNTSSTTKSGWAASPFANSNVPATPITGRAGIAPIDWESLEQVAIEDAMEAEERARKAAKRREKKNRKKEKARKEAVAKAADAAAKKREKLILAWRSKVVSACQSNEVKKLEELLEESPLTASPSVAANMINDTLVNNSNHNNNNEGGGDEEALVAPPPMTMATITPHLEFLLPHTVAKNRTAAERGHEARTKLAQYLMSTNLPLIFTAPLRTGRTALHTACLYGELDFVEHAIALAETWPQEGDYSALPHNWLQIACQESGFAPIHYAILSGSKAILEALLKAGADAKTKSTDTHTWKSRYVCRRLFVSLVVVFVGTPCSLVKCF